MPDTLGSLRAQIQDWLAGDTVPDSRINDAINDAVEDLFMSLILAADNVFNGGPSSVTINSAAERVTLTTISDPSVAPTINSTALGSLPQHTVFAAYSYVTDSGSETLLSPQSTAVIAVNNVASIAAPAFVSGAIGWNCFVGDNATRLARQNAEPLPFANAFNPSQPFEEPETGFVDNPDMPLPPTENTTGDNIFYISHLERQLSSGNYKAYDAGAIDSAFTRRFASLIATSSEYQSYAWDLINQRQLEIRPAAGATFTPRYFFIVKPRRMRFDNSPLPFPTIPSTAFLRMFALSELLDSIYEVEAATRWETRAEGQRLKCMRAMTKVNVNRNNRVTPYMY